MVRIVAQNPQDYPQDADLRLSKVGCVVPFRTMEISEYGHVSLCCHTWLPEYCGNVLTDSLEEILQNSKRQEILSGMRRGCFDHCTDHCPSIDQFLATGSTPRFLPLDQLDQGIDMFDYTINFIYDESCNLTCPSCRKHLIVHRPDDLSNPVSMRLLGIHDRVKQMVQLLLDQGHVVKLNITGSGDAFASPLYWSYLKELAGQQLSPNLKLSLNTNGVLMTERSWNEIRPLWPLIKIISVSVDAATDDTYKKVRRGGNFQRLVANLDHLNVMIARGDLPNLNTYTTNFIVQRDNFRELKQFVEWQLQYQTLSVVWLNQIAQWNHLSDDEYADMAIWRDGNSQRSELCDLLRDPVFDDPRVYLGNLSGIRMEALQQLPI